MMVIEFNLLISVDFVPLISLMFAPLISCSYKKWYTGLEVNYLSLIYVVTFCR